MLRATNTIILLSVIHCAQRLTTAEPERPVDLPLHDAGNPQYSMTHSARALLEHIGLDNTHLFIPKPALGNALHEG